MANNMLYFGLLLLLAVQFWNMLRTRVSLMQMNAKASAADRPIAKSSPTGKKPWHVIEQYIEWHSVESLRRQPENRLYAVAYYSCPQQAGNRLHHFMNSFLWAILTNRTLLWDYWDTQNCQQYGQDHDSGICASANHVKDCDNILERSRWIPSYQDVSRRLNLPGRPHQVSHWATHWNGDEKENRKYGIKPENRIGVDADYKHLVVAFPQMLGRLGMAPRKSKQLLHTFWARSTAASLYSLGTDFLYGMLFRRSFRFTKAILETNQYHHPKEFSLSLHSRHSNVTNEGCAIDHEKNCLDQVLAAREEKQEFCRAFLMSDRVCTLSKLSQFLRNKRNCTVQIANHDLGESWRAEHGPYAGVGYFQDLALASRARSAFVGTRRSSSALLKELIEYDRRMEALEAFGDAEKVPALAECVF